MQGLDKLGASEPASHASHASHHVSHARQMLVPSPFSFLRLLAIWHEFSLSSHNVFHFSKDEPLIYKKTFTQAEWQKIINAFPEKVPLSQLPKVTNQTFQVNVRKTAKEALAKCAICQKTITTGDLQASTEGAYRTIHRTWILRTGN